MTTATSIVTPLAADIERLTLDQDDIAALRTCESISFHHNNKTGRYIRAMLDTIVDTRVYSAREQRLFPETRDVGAGNRARIIEASSSIYGYHEDATGNTWTHRDYPNAVCSALISSASDSRVWSTIATLLRPGDRLHLGWLASHDTDLLREAELHQDYLQLTAVRGDRQFTFIVADQITPAYYPVRMIRRHG